MRTVVVIFILAWITIAGEIYSDAALTSGKPSNTAAPDPATAARAWAQTRVSGPQKPPERLSNRRKSGGLFDLWTHAIG
jgi:hypothetical protein